MSNLIPRQLKDKRPYRNNVKDGGESFLSVPRNILVAGRFYIAVSFARCHFR